MPDLSNDRESEAASLAWATDLMTHQTRRTWWVPLLAVPLAQVVTAAEVSTFLLLDPDELTEAREWAGVVLDHVREESAQGWSPRAALAAANLTTIYSMALTQVFGLKWTAARFLDLPDDLVGEALITRLGRVLGERPEPPAWLAVVALPLLEDPAVGRRRRELLPQPESFFAPVTRALDRRCYELGLGGWADAARHSAEVWTAERWRGTLMACTSAIVPEVLSWVLDRGLPRPVASGPTVPGNRRPRPDRRAALARELGDVHEALAGAKQAAQAARAAAAAASLREAELIQSRDRALLRVKELETREKATAATLRELKSRLAGYEATERRAAATGMDEAPPAPDQVSPPLPADLLAGRIVFLFSGQDRGAAARAQAEAIGALGPDEVRRYDVRQGRPGPDQFPPGAVVVVDTRFVGHSHTEEIESRVRRSPSDVIYVTLKAGEGGVGQRLAERLGKGRLGRRADPS